MNLQRLQINHQSLTDSPLEKTDKRISVGKGKIDSLKLELLHGSPSCYLVSGYRGSGKTSFVNLVKDEIGKEEAGRKSNENTPPRLIFVKSNFSSYKGHEKLMRVLIRNTCEQLFSDQGFITEHYKKMQEGLRSLHLRTYYDVKEQLSQSTKQEEKIEFKAEGFLWATIKIIWPLLFPASIGIFHFFQRWADSPLVIGVSLIVGLSGLLLNAINYNRSRTKTKNETNTADSIYDDEIAELLFIRQLDELKKFNVQMVFVIDELDKVEDPAVLKNLINEMKPVMLSGKAHFILVAGQDLSYQYHASLFSDDDVISTLFSRVIHVSLATTDGLSAFFNQHLRITTEDVDANDVRTFVNHLVYKSKLVPRAFISRLRQQLEWETLSEADGGAMAYIDMARQKEERIWKNVMRDSHCLETINKIFGERIKIHALEESVEDYLGMQLFSASAELLYKNKSIEDIKRTYLESSELQDKHFYHVLEPALTDLKAALIPESPKETAATEIPRTEPTQTTTPQTETFSTDNITSDAAPLKTTPVPHKEPVKKEEVPKSKINKATRKTLTKTKEEEVRRIQLKKFDDDYRKFKSVVSSGLELLDPAQKTSDESMYSLLEKATNKKLLEVILPPANGPDADVMQQFENATDADFIARRFEVMQLIGFDYHKWVKTFSERVLDRYLWSTGNTFQPTGTPDVFYQPANSPLEFLLETMYYTTILAIGEKEISGLVSKLMEQNMRRVRGVGASHGVYGLVVVFIDGSGFPIDDYQFRSRLLLDKAFKVIADKIKVVYCPTQNLGTLDYSIRKLKLEATQQYDPRETEIRPL